MIVFPFIIQEQLISSSFCKILGWSILIQSFAKLIMGDILADTAILSNASKKEPLCSCYEHTSRVCLQLNGMPVPVTLNFLGANSHKTHTISCVQLCMLYIVYIVSVSVGKCVPSQRRGGKREAVR